MKIIKLFAMCSYRHQLVDLWEKEAQKSTRLKKQNNGLKVNFLKPKYSTGSQMRDDTVTLSGVGARMLLRDHPLMMYNGGRSWPPVWRWRGGNDNRNPRGEVGILLDVALSCVPPMPACYLIMEHTGAEYIGTLLLNDGAFSRLVFDVLLQNRFRPLREIGAIDLSYTL